MSNQHRVEPNTLWSQLSPLERDVARLIAANFTNGVIAHRLDKKPTHIARVVATLYVKSGVAPPTGEKRRRYGDREKLQRWAVGLFASEEARSEAAQ